MAAPWEADCHPVLRTPCWLSARGDLSSVPSGEFWQLPSWAAPLCRRLLREEFKSGRLEAAPSKAAALELLCERLKFEPDAASAIHKALFTERLETFLEDSLITGMCRWGLQI